MKKKEKTLEENVAFIASTLKTNTFYTGSGALVGLVALVIALVALVN